MAFTGVFVGFADLVLLMEAGAAGVSFSDDFLGTVPLERTLASLTCRSGLTIVLEQCLRVGIVQSPMDDRPLIILHDHRLGEAHSAHRLH